MIKFLSCSFVCTVVAALAAAQSPGKVIYGPDDRVDVIDANDQNLVQLSRSVCALVEDSQITDNGDGTFTLQTFPYTISGFPPCLGEAFAEQRVAAFCTGFWVGDDIIVTAGHCLSSSNPAADLQGITFVFGFQETGGKVAQTTFNANQVYRGTSIISRMLTNTTDYSVIRVDRNVEVPGATPLAIRRSGAVSVGTNVGVIGHPSGLPLKIAFGATTQVRTNSPSSNTFVANLDTYGGNSGSPVFNAATNEVEGILVSGATDFQFTSNCFFSNELADNEGQEQVTKSTVWAEFVDGGAVDPCGFASSGSSGERTPGDAAIVAICAGLLLLAGRVRRPRTASEGVLRG